MRQTDAWGLALHQSRAATQTSAGADNPGMNSTPPARLQPGSSYAAPFELLSACHERVARSLALLARLLEHLETRGEADALARDAAADVRRYFGVAAPLHHQDEELHVFPALETAPDGAALCAGLRRQHREMEALWAQLDPALAALDSAALPRLRQLAEAFIALYRGHLAAEDELVFPAARQQLPDAAQAAMGIEMAARRGLDLTGSAAPGSR